MPTKRLTDRFLKNLKTEKKQEDFWDETFSGTFGVRVTDREVKPSLCAIVSADGDGGLNWGAILH